MAMRAVLPSYAPETLEFYIREDDQGFAETFSYEGVGAGGIKELFLAGGSFFGPREDSQWILNLVASLMRREYFASIDSPSTRLRRALKRANEALEDVRQSRHGLWPGGISFFVAVIIERKIFVAFSGACRVMLWRDGTMLDVGKGISGEQAPEKGGAAFATFSSVIEGALEKNDVMLVETGLPNDARVLDECFAALKKKTYKRQPADFSKKLAELFRGIAAGFVVAMAPEIKGSPEKNSARTRENGFALKLPALSSAMQRRGISLPDLQQIVFMKKLLGLLSFTEGFVAVRERAGSLFPQPGIVARRALNVFLRLLPRHNNEVREHAIQRSLRTELRYQRQRGLAFLQHQGVRARDVVRSWMGRIKTHRATPVVALAALIVLFASVVMPRLTSRERDLALAKDSAARIEQLLEQVEAAQIFGDKAQALRVLAEISDIFSEISRRGLVDDALTQKIDALDEETEVLRNELLQRVLLGAQEVVATFKNFPVSFDPVQFVGFPKTKPTKLFFVAKNQSGIWRYDLTKNQGKFIFSEVSDRGFFDIAVSGAQSDILIFVSRERLVSFSATLEKIIGGISFTGKNTPQAILGVSSDARNVYLAFEDSAKGFFLKRVAVGEKGTLKDTEGKTIFFQKKSNLSETTRDILAHEKYVYAIDDTGTLTPFVPGKALKSFAPEFEPREARIAQLDVVSSKNRFFALDIAVGRILTFDAQSRAFMKQLSADALKNAIAFFIPEEEDSLFVLTEQELLRFQLPAL